MNRSARILTLGALAAIATSAPAPAPAAKRTTCTKVAGDTVYRDRTLRLIQTETRSKSDADLVMLRLRFCRPGRTGAPKTLVRFRNTLDGSVIVYAVVRAGGHIGLELAEQTGTTDSTALHVYDTRNQDRPFAYSSENAFTYFVTSGGGVAILEGGKLTAWDGAGERVLAASGATELTGVGSTIYWTAGGAAARATLTGEARRQS